MNPMKRVWVAVSLVAAAGVVAGAVQLAGRSTEQTTPKPSPTGSSSIPASPSASPAPTPDPVSLQALIQKDYDGRDLSLGRVIARNSAFTRYFATFKSGTLTISGTLHIPRGTGPFPVLIFNHGFRVTATYVNGEGLRREQDYLAQRGYAVLHVDYRNHAQSDDDPAAEDNLRLGYTEDAINAVLAVKSSSIPTLDRERIGMLGRSMGGGVTLNVAVVRPDLVGAFVLFDPVSSNTIDNFNKWTAGSPAGNRILSTYGSPRDNPTFWRNVSPVGFFGRVSRPILIHHGTADTSTPLSWTRRTVAALEAKDKDVTLLLYKGEPHVFGAAWPLAMSRTQAFFDARLKP